MDRETHQAIIALRNELEELRLRVKALEPQDPTEPTEPTNTPPALFTSTFGGTNA